MREDQLQAVEQAVRRAEEEGGGEIVVYLTKMSDEYHLAPWKGAALGSLALTLVAAIGFDGLARWDVWVEAWLLGPPAVGAALGFLAGRLVEPFRRSLIDRELVDERVERRAAEVFLSEEVFATRERDAVLLFVSLFERRVVLLADSGVSRAVPQRAWDGVTGSLAQAIRRNQAFEGLLAAVEQLGRVLARHRPGLEDDNELEDAPRVGDAP